MMNIYLELVFLMNEEKNGDSYTCDFHFNFTNYYLLLYWKYRND